MALWREDEARRQEVWLSMFTVQTQYADVATHILL